MHLRYEIWNLFSEELISIRHHWKQTMVLLKSEIIFDNLSSYERHYFVNKGTPSQGYGFSSSHVWMWELNYKESWTQKNSCFWTVVLEKTLESPLDFKEIKPVNCKGNWSWIFIGRTDAGQYFGHLIQRTDSFEKTLILGKIEGRRRRGQQRMRWLDGITDSMGLHKAEEGETRENAKLATLSCALGQYSLYVCFSCNICEL